ncbi:hypothetical protein MMPV_008504 [Pyropia vietnamensis]
MATAFVPALPVAAAARPQRATVGSHRARPAWPPRCPPPALIRTTRAAAVPPPPTGPMGGTPAADNAAGTDVAAASSVASTPAAASGSASTSTSASTSAVMGEGAKMPSSSAASPAPSRRAELKGEDYCAMESAAALLLLSRAVAAVRDGGSRPAGSDVEAALLTIEANQRRARSVTDVRELAGEWELVFTAGAARKGRQWNPSAWPLYFPVRARQTFTLLRSDSGTFDNAVYGLGSVFRFTGPFRWVGGGRNRAEFTFTTASLRVGPFPAVTFPAGGPPSLDGLTAKTLPFFTFFFCRRGILAARGRGGGVALYRRIRKQDLSLKEA